MEVIALILLKHKYNQSDIQSLDILIVIWLVCFSQHERKFRARLFIAILWMVAKGGNDMT